MNNRFSHSIAAFGVLLAVTASSLGSQADTAQAVQFDSGEGKVSLIELYTSEGCSSCPPADRWLSSLGEGDEVWRDVVPLAFHVSYWDRLGWPDRFAQRKFDTRQRALAARVNSGVYTPGMFRDGAELRNWRRTPAQSIEKTFASVTPDLPAVGNLQLKQGEAGQWNVTFTPSAGSNRRADGVFVAVLGNSLNNDVQRGENAGRVLEHDFVVLNLEHAALNTVATPNAVATPNVVLQASFMVDTSITDHPAIAAWVVDAEGNPLQAVGGELPAS